MGFTPATQGAKKMHGETCVRARRAGPTCHRVWAGAAAAAQPGLAPAGRVHSVLDRRLRQAVDILLLLAVALPSILSLYELWITMGTSPTPFDPLSRAWAWIYLFLNIGAPDPTVLAFATQTLQYLCGFDAPNEMRDAMRLPYSLRSDL
jgi:hypothetical protein